MNQDTNEDRIPLREYWQEYERQKKALGFRLSPREYQDAIEQITEGLDGRPELFEDIERA